jgi:hypothetical protein
VLEPDTQSTHTNRRFSRKYVTARRAKSSFTDLNWQPSSIKDRTKHRPQISGDHRIGNAPHHFCFPFGMYGAIQKLTNNGRSRLHSGLQERAKNSTALRSTDS